MNIINATLILSCMLLQTALCADDVLDPQTAQVQSGPRFVPATPPKSTTWTNYHPAANLSMHRNMARELNLTTNQMAQMNEAVNAFARESRARTQNPGLSPEQRQGQQELARHELDAKLQTILTPEQYARFKTPPMHKSTPKALPRRATGATNGPTAPPAAQ